MAMVFISKPEQKLLSQSVLPLKTLKQMEVSNLVAIVIGVIFSGFVGMIVFIFTNHSNQTTKRIDSRQEETQAHAEKLSLIEQRLSKHEQRLDTLDEFKKDVKEIMTRIESKIESLMERLINAK
jgi:peptidoglycan hydrolase CwlO-like protein